MLVPPTARETLGGIRNSPASRLHMKRTYTGSRSKSKSRKLKITWLAVAPGQVEPGDSRPASPRLRELRSSGIKEGFQNSSSPSSTVPEVCGKPAHRRTAANDHQVVNLDTSAIIFLCNVVLSNLKVCVCHCSGNRLIYRVSGGKRSKGSDMELC